MEERKLPASGAVNHPPKKKLKVDSSKAPLSKSKTNPSKGKSLSSSSKTQKPNPKEVGKNVWWFTQKAKKQEKKNAGPTEMSKTVTNEKASPKSSKTEVGESEAIKKKALLQVKKKRQRKNRLLKKKLKSGENTEGVNSNDSRANTNLTQIKKNLNSKDLTQAGLKNSQRESELSPSVSLQKSGGQKQKRKRVKKFKAVKNAKDGGQVALGLKKETQVKENAGPIEMSKTVTNEKASPKSSKTEVGELKAKKKKALQLKKKRQRKNRLLKKKLKSGENTEGVISNDSRANTNLTQIKKNLNSKDLTQGGLKNSQRESELSPSVSLQKSGGQKQKRKRVKKFKAVQNAKDGVQVAPGLKKETQVKGESTEEDSTTSEKDSSKGSQVETKDASIKASKGEVSSNWKALLPMVEKSRNERKKYKKKDQSGENKDNSKQSKPDIWFDGVDPSLIRANEKEGEDDGEDDVQSETGYNPLLRKDAQDCLTKCLAIDCEMVGTGPKGCKSILARVSIVNQYGYCVCDKYITPQEPVTDYRTFVSGIRPQDLKTKGESFETVQKEVADLLKGRIVVGHALSNDFKVLFFNHPRRLVRDTSNYQPFKNLFKSRRPGLKKLTELVLKVKVQKGEHNSVEDAQAAMKLYMLHRKQWEKSLRDKTVSSTSASSSKTHKLGKATLT